MPDLEPLDLATAQDSLFRPHLDSEFTLLREGREVVVTLVQIAAYPDHRATDERQKRKPFGLVFKCETAVLPQGLYTLTHPALPACGLFLSPFEGGADWCKLEAIFN